MYLIPENAGTVPVLFFKYICLLVVVIITKLSFIGSINGKPLEFHRFFKMICFTAGFMIHDKSSNFFLFLNSCQWLLGSM